MKSLLAKLLQKSGSLIAAVFIGLMAVSLMTGWILDFALQMIFLAVLMGRVKIEALGEWLEKK